MEARRGAGALSPFLSWLCEATLMLLLAAGGGGSGGGGGGDGARDADVLSDDPASRAMQALVDFRAG